MHNQLKSETLAKNIMFCSSLTIAFPTQITNKLQIGPKDQTGVRNSTPYLLWALVY